MHTSAAAITHLQSPHPEMPNIYPLNRWYLDLKTSAYLPNPLCEDTNSYDLLLK